ncbi:hypothetical protein F4777DRAFT_243160 [Nemania sp. FL0916]|nr:hypothetical protein F4777DRAFT_243160 [Nemania sp. FL0916]
MTSRSVGSAKKQPLAKFFQQTFVSHPYDEDAQNHMCVQCTRKRSPKKLAKLKCGHQWCGFCLRRLFRDAIEDPQGMPPRCCTSDIIPLEYVHGQLDDEIIRAWTEKFAASSSKGRHYCPRSKCREMIQPGDYRYHKNGRTSATCRNCHTEICGECYKKWHDSKHCPTGADTAQFLKAGKDAGWQRCFQCKAMVELKEGCNHMTCRCGAQFCMNCGSKWKACECPFDLDEDELDAMQIPTPMVSRNRLGGPDLPRTLRPGLSYAHEPQRYRGHGDEHRPQQPHYLDDEDIEDEDEEDDDDDDDYMNDAGNMTGFGNPAGHFMGEDYGRRSHGPAVPAVPAVPSVPMTPPSVTLERPKAGGNYVSGVNKARGVRGPSMERLADRFSGQRQNFSPNSHGYGHAPPPTVPPLGMGLPPLHHQAPMVPNPISRRHTMDDDMFEVPFGPHYAPPSMPRRATAHTYMDDFAIPPPMGRHRNRHMGQMGQMGPMGPMGHTRGSELAGLTGPGSGMNRVFEWVNHVPYHSPDSQTIA